MDTYEAIFRRRSVRKYSDKNLSSSFLGKLDDNTDDLDKLYEDIDIEVNIIKDGTKIQKIMSGIIGSYGKIKAPHYMIITSEKKKGYLENVGFALEPIVLKLTKAMVGTCWIGGHVPKEELKNIVKIKDDHEAVILISFGHAEDELLRDKKDAKRKDISKLINGDIDDGWKPYIECARFAPSAVNSQPWRFKEEGNKLHAYSVKRNRFTKLVAGNLHLLNKIDVGIALSHMDIASRKFGDDLEFKYLRNCPSINKLKYITTGIKT